MLKKLAFISLFISSLHLLSASQVVAGGGPVYFRLEPNASLAPGEQYIVHAEVYADGPTYPTYCKKCSITLKFRDPQDSDYISQNSKITDDSGRIYAKVISKVSGPRVIYADIVNAEGIKIESNSQVILNYAGEFIPSNPEVTQQSVETHVIEAPKVKTITDIEPDVVIIEKQSTDSAQIEKLNTKVNDLQKQLDKSNKKQEVLEFKLTSLIAWLKSFVPRFTLD